MPNEGYLFFNSGKFTGVPNGEFNTASVVNFLMMHERFSMRSSKKSYMGVIIKLIPTVISLAYQHYMVAMYDFHIRTSLTKYCSSQR